MADYRKKCRGGFTLIELIVVVAIIGILAAVLAPSYIQYVEKARKAEVISEASAVNSAAQIAITAELAANGCTGGGVFKTDSGAEVGRLTNYWLSKDGLLNSNSKGTALAKAFVQSLNLSRGKSSSVPVSSDYPSSDEKSRYGCENNEARFQVLYGRDYNIICTEYSRNGYFVKISSGGVTAEKVIKNQPYFTCATPYNNEFL